VTLGDVGTRTGAQYISSLRDGREVYLRGRRVEDVTEEEAFRNIVSTIAGLYDLQHDPSYQGAITFEEGGERFGNIFRLTRTPSDLEAMRRYSQLWHEQTAGMLGRAPDFLSAMMVGLYNISFDLEDFNPRFAKNARMFYYYCRREDLCLTHAFVPPQVDRTKSRKENGDVAVVDENERGIVVRGARQVATLAPISNELLVFAFMPREDEDEISAWFCIPLATEGLKVICREDYVRGRSPWDHPLAVPYDEADALVVFDDVLVPWDRVFLHGKGAAKFSYRIIPKFIAWAGYTALIRAVVKLQFLFGLASMVADYIGIADVQHVQEKLGEMLFYVGLMEDALRGIEATPLEQPRSGLLMPDYRRIIYARLIAGTHIFPRFSEIIRQLMAAGLIMLPTEADFEDARLRGYIESYMRGRGVTAREKVALFRLAYDAVADQFGGRQLQYEMFHAGDPVRLKMAYYQAADKSKYRALVERQLARLRAHSKHS
jgi:4-hydroxyphenylacetate 3-monooxygenase